MMIKRNANVLKLYLTTIRDKKMGCDTGYQKNGDLNKNERA